MEKSFLPALIFNAILFYLFAMFHWSVGGFRIIYCGNLLLYLPGILLLRRQKLRKFSEEFLTPGTVILCLMLTSFFFFVRGMECYSWDAVSHWMTSVKFFFAEEKLCCEYPSEILLHASYPPGMCMMSMLVHRCFPGIPFREDLVCFAYILPIYGSLVYLLSDVKWGQRKNILTAVVLWSLFIPLMRYQGYYFLCYTDLCLAAVMAAAFYNLLKIREYNVGDLILFSFLNGWMFMIRNAGWGYSLVLLILFGIFLIIDRRNAFFDGNGKFSWAKTSAVSFVFLLPVLLKYSWKSLLVYYATPLRFGGNNITLHGIKEMFGSFTDPGWNFLKNYLGSVWGYLFITFFLLFVPAVIRRLTGEEVLRRRLKLTVFFFFTASVLFLIGMFFYYLFEFQYGNLFPSLDRYCVNFFVIPVLVLLYLLADYWCTRSAVAVRQRRILFSGILFLIIIIHGYFSITLFGEHFAYKHWRRECDAVLNYRHLFSDGVKFGHISTTGNGFKAFYMQSLFPYHYTKKIAEDPVLQGGAASKARPYSVPVSPEELRHQFRAVQFIFIDNPEEDFIKDFRSVFADGFDPELKTIQKRLFRVTPEGKLTPAE